MLTRISVIALNTYREAVRARVLHGLFALALCTAAYSLVVGAYTSKNAMRVVSDLGSASISLYGVIVAVVLGATSLYRELELKTIFPILARPIGRGEYLVGKYIGTVLTLTVFIAANAGVLLLALGQMAGRSFTLVFGVGVGVTALISLVGWWRRRWLTYLPILWAAIILLWGLLVADSAPDHRRVVAGLSLLAVCEVAIVAAIATVFSAFSSPFLTAIFTFGVFIVGRTADTLAHLPPKVFGDAIHAMGVSLSKVVPNLMLYVPERTLLTGEAPNVELGPYLAQSGLHALAWVTGLLAVATLIFRRRDFL
jgi:hypothetical protein